MINPRKESYLQARDLWNLLVICVPSFVNSIKIWCLCGIIHWPGSRRAIKICFSDKFVQARDIFISSRHATTPWRRLFESSPNTRGKEGANTNHSPFFFSDRFQQLPSDYCLRGHSNKVPGFLPTFKAKWHVICLSNALPWDLTVRPKWCIVLHSTAHSGESTLHYAKSKPLLFTWTSLRSFSARCPPWVTGCMAVSVPLMETSKQEKDSTKCQERDANLV